MREVGGRTGPPALQAGGGGAAATRLMGSAGVSSAEFCEKQMSTSVDRAKAGRKVYDCFTFNGEFDVLDIHLNVLSPIVDRFVLVEAHETFTGQPKPLYFAENKSRFAPFLDKIIHVEVERMADAGTNPWVREAHHKGACTRGLADAAPHDLVIASDVDEIVKPPALVGALRRAAGRITYFEGVYYHFRLNWRLVGRQDLKTARMIEMRHFKNGFHMRQTKGCRSESLPQAIEYALWLPYAASRHGTFLGRQIMWEGCWHFSFAMEADEIRRKLTSYSHTHRKSASYMTPGSIEKMMTRRVSVFGQPMDVSPLSEIPEHVRENSDRFCNLLDI